MEWKSSVLRCFDGDDHCAVCRFIAGKGSVEDMRETIRILDNQLADQESYNRTLVNTLRDQQCRK